MSAKPTHFLCVLLLATVVGCSRTELVYGNADWFLQRWAEDLLDPESGQRDAWELVMDQAMQTHRRDLLPDVIRILRTAEIAAADGLDRQELNCWVGLFDQAIQDHANWAVGPTAMVLSEVSPVQIEHLAGELRERNQDYRDDYVDQNLERRQQARVERYAGRIERWTGELSTGQLRLIEQSVSTMPDLVEGWLAYREDRQLRLLELLRAGVDRAELQGYLGSWWIDLEGRPPALVEQMKALRLASLDLVLHLDANLSAGQRATFVDKVAGLRNDFERLVGKQGQQVPVQAATDPCVAAPRPLSN